MILTIKNNKHSKTINTSKLHQIKPTKIKVGKKKHKNNWICNYIYGGLGKIN